MRMTVDDAIVYGKGRVHSDLAKMLLADLMGINSLELLMHLDEEVDEEILEVYKYRVDELKKGRPIQYIIGNVNFCGNTLEVNENVLIPRFETELLVKETIDRIKRDFPHPIKLIDLGCGSGAIGLSIKKELSDVDVTLLDISEGALEVAQRNACNLKLDVHFCKNDMLNGIDERYDVIISNPPYIRTDEEIEDIVKNNEPHLALYGGVDGLDYYRQILSNVSKNISDQYLIAFEIGDLQREAILALANEYLTDFNFECLKDYSSRDRIVFISNK